MVALPRFAPTARPWLLKRDKSRICAA